MSKVHSGSARPAARAIASHPAVAGFRPAAAALALAAVFALQPTAGRAQPAGAQVIHGQASLTRNGSNLLVTTQNGPGSNHSAINWQSFSVPAGSITQFDQPSAGSTSINRVVGPDPSAIFGTLRSNGRLVLVNTAGIAVGSGAVVDTGGFTASTLQMSEADAIAGRLRFFNDGTSRGLTVDGTVRAQGGDVVLIAPDVQTAGPALVQSDGATLLVAGRKVEITGRGLEGIHLEVQAGERAVNLGTLRGDAVGIFAGTLRHSGVVQAQALTVEGGKVVLQASGDNLVSGAIAATAAADKGGSIDVFGQRVGLLAGAAVDASGAQGGGQVRVGGDYQGRNPAVPNAAQAYVDASATIRADATQQGDGGRVIVWSDAATRMHGQVSARGGARGGNGGFTEVSGKKSLEFTGRVDLRAPKGAAGTLLLDPEDLAIFHEKPPVGTLGPVYGSQNTFPIGLDVVGDPTAVFGPTAPATVRLSDAHLNAQLGFSHVLVTTSSTVSLNQGGQITVEPDAVVTWNNSSQLALRADKGIDILGTIRATDPGAKLQLRALNGNITQGGPLAAASGTTATGSIEVPSLLVRASGSAGDAGQVDLSGTNKVGQLAATVDAAGAQFTFQSDQAVTIAGVSTVFSLDPEMGSGNGISVPSGAVNVTSAGTLAVAAGVQVAGGSVSLVSTGGDVRFGEGSSAHATNGTLKVSASESITGSGAFFTNGGDAAGKLGAITLEAGASLHFGMVDSAATGGNAHAGTVTLHAGGDIVGDQVFAVGSTIFAGEGVAPTTAVAFGNGGNGAAVEVTSESGSIAIGSISTYGGFAPTGLPGAAGSVTVTARGLAPTTAGLVSNRFGIDLPPASIAIGQVDAVGSWGSSGGDGGTVTLAADHGSVAIGTIDVTGGSSFGEGVGGKGGSISVTANSDIVFASPPRLTVAALTETGATTFGFGSGISADGGTGSTGGHGGDVSLRLGGSLSGTLVLARGGDGSHGVPAEVVPQPGTFTHPDGGAGGTGGSITLERVGSNAHLGFDVLLDASGGLGGWAGTGTTGVGGVGGAGGTITLKAPDGDLWLRGLVHAGAGIGGLDTAGVPAAGGAATGVIDISAQQLTLEAALAGDLVKIAAAPSTRGVRLGGTDNGTALHLSQQELALVTAGTLEIGNLNSVGGILVDGAIVLGEAQVPTLRLLTASAIGASPAGSLSVGNLDARAGGVSLDQVRIGHTLTGRGGVGGFRVANRSDAELTIGADGIVGGKGPVQVATAGRLVLSGPVSDAGAGDAVILSASSLDVGQGGAIQAPAGRWLVYLDQPQGSNFGHLASGNLALWGRPVAAGAIVPETGNRYLFALRPTVDVVAGSASKVYDGTAAFDGVLPTVTGLVDAAAFGNVFLQDAPAGSFGAPSKNVGTHALGQGNYGVAGYDVRFTGGLLTITPRALTISLAAQDKVYDGTTTAAFSFGDDRLAGDTLVVAGSAAFADKNAGSGKLVQGAITGLAGLDAANYTLVSTAPTTQASIARRSLNLTVSAQDKVYDGGTTATLAASADNRMPGDVVTLLLSGRFADKNVGSDKQVALDAALGGVDAGNYLVKLPATPVTADITPRALHVTVAGIDKVYDGTTSAAVAFADTRIAGDTLVVGGSASFGDRNAGAGKLVTATLAPLQGADAGNYVLATPSATTRAAITPAPLTIVARDASKTQGTTLAFNGSEFTATGLVAGETIGSVTLASAGADAAAKADAYAITASAPVGGSGFLPSNYGIRFQDGLLTVLPAPAAPGAPAGAVAPIAQQVNNQVVTFAQLFVQEALAQQRQESADKRIGNDDIVVTDTACKP